MRKKYTKYGLMISTFLLAIVMFIPLGLSDDLNGSVTVVNTNPVIEELSPQDDYETGTNVVSLKANISDDSPSVDVEFYLKNNGEYELVDTVTIEYPYDGKVAKTSVSLSDGINKWYIIAEDSYGASVNNTDSSRTIVFDEQTSDGGGSGSDDTTTSPTGNIALGQGYMLLGFIFLIAGIGFMYYKEF